MTATTNTPEIEFLSYNRELAPYFKQINTQWISQMFIVEKGDLTSLDHPEEEIINRGGEVFFAKHKTLGVVGCCALLQKEPGVFELTKMGVLESARGLKIGEPLLLHVLQHAKTMSMKRLFLLTNKNCKAAIHLYLKNGFVHDPKVMQLYGGLYDRCDVAMKYESIWQD